VLQGEVHRDTDVLLLYPLDLLSVDQRFGSWMVQYGYCNYATEEDLCRWGRVTADGRISLRGRRYRVLGALFEPFVRTRTLALMRQMLARGGSVLWMATPPECFEADPGRPGREWADLFGVSFDRPTLGGQPAPGGRVSFSGALAGTPPMSIPSALLPDWVYPVTARGAQVVARLGSRTVGTLRSYPSGGRALYLGFRARDDQSASTGEDLSTLFACLSALGAYPGQDHPERLSRTTELLANRFPNGVVTVTSHFRHVVEQWPGGFKRDPERDAPIVARLALPPNELDLPSQRLDGHTLTYRGAELLSYRVTAGRLSAFCGHATTGLTVDGVAYRFAQQPVTLAWKPLERAELAPGVRAAHRLWVSAPGDIRLPVDARGWRSVRAALAQGTEAGDPVKAQADGATLLVTIPPAHSGRWLFVGDW